MSNPLHLHIPGNDELLPALEWPDRRSQTLLRTAHDCRRAAYLYVRHNGGTPGYHLDRGTLAHAVFERMALILLEQGEAAFLEPSEVAAIRKGGSPHTLGGQIASVTAALVDEVARERPDLPLPFGDREAVRIMAWHWAVGMELHPERLIAVERKFVMEVNGRTVSGRVDLASITPDGICDVDDFKTSFNLPDQETFDAGFQTKLYSALIAFGRPVEKLADGSEVLGEPVAQGVNLFRGRERYPRYLRKTDGRMQYREKVRTRTDLHDFMADLAALLDDLEARMAAPEAAWPARSGSHCTMCPAPLECPLPAVARNFEGSIGSPEQAAVLIEAVDRQDEVTRRLKKEIRNWLKANGSVRFGKDGLAVLEHESKVSTDWEGLERAVHEAVQYGAPFDMADHRREGGSLRMKFRRLTAEELEAEGAQRTEGERDERDDAERWGDGVPF